MSQDEMVEALHRIHSLDPHICRRHVRDHFLSTQMAMKYAEVYPEVIADYTHPDVTKIDRPPVKIRSSPRTAA